MCKNIFFCLLFWGIFFSHAKVHLLKVGHGANFFMPLNMYAYQGDTLKIINYTNKNTLFFSGVIENSISLLFKSEHIILLENDGNLEITSSLYPQIKANIVVKSKKKVLKPFFNESTTNDIYDFYIGNAISEEVDVKVVDIVGKVILDTKTYLSGGRGKISLKNIAKGIYFVKISKEHKQLYFQKIFKS